MGPLKSKISGDMDQLSASQALAWPSTYTEGDLGQGGIEGA